MQQTNTETTHRPPTRLPRERRVSPSPPCRDHQVGRSVWAWLYRHAGVLSIALCWAFAFSAILVPPDPEQVGTGGKLCMLALLFLGFGVGLIVGRGEDDL